jgi:hypothetical protein
MTPPAGRRSPTGRIREARVRRGDGDHLLERRRHRVRADAVHVAAGGVGCGRDLLCSPISRLRVAAQSHLAARQ